MNEIYQYLHDDLIQPKIELFEKFVNVNGQIVLSKRKSLDVEYFNNAFEKMEANRLIVATIVLHPSRVSELKKIPKNYVDFCKPEDIVMTGIIASLWGANIIECDKLDKKTVYFLAVIHLIKEIIITDKNNNMSNQKNGIVKLVLK